MRTIRMLLLALFLNPLWIYFTSHWFILPYRFPDCSFISFFAFFARSFNLSQVLLSVAHSYCGLFMWCTPSNFYLVEYTIRCGSWHAVFSVYEALFYHFVFAIRQRHRNQSMLFSFSSTSSTLTLLLIFAFRYCVCHHFSLTPSICKMIDLKGETRFALCLSPSSGVCMCEFWLQNA